MQPAPVRSSLVAMALSAACAVLAGGCDMDRDVNATSRVPPLPQWTYDSSQVFPADRSLARPEDGVMLPDGRLLVGDQVHGLRLVEPDGRNRPFGDLAAAGYRHAPPTHEAAANGISLEPGGTHVLLADILSGAIYRVDVSSGAAEKLYQHRFGINTAIRDSTGAIWFTQSAHNTPEAGEARMWASLDVPSPEGALLRLGFRDGRLAERAQVVDDLLHFANGLALDEANGYLYVAETLGGRVLRYRADPAAGTASNRTVFVEGAAADNLELDDEGRLWVALPLTNEVLIVDPATGRQHTAFRSLTEEQQAVVDEFHRRGRAGARRLELFTPAMWAPLPGLVTGVIVGPADHPVYLTGLGPALLKLPR
jgi:sugar lactone lactonase YvrE